MSYDPMEEPVLTIQWRGRRSGKRAATEAALREALRERAAEVDKVFGATRARTGALLAPFLEDLTVYGVAMIGPAGERIDPRKAVLR